jgi:hypothetical protein
MGVFFNPYTLAGHSNRSPQEYIEIVYTQRWDNISGFSILKESVNSMFGFAEKKKRDFFLKRVICGSLGRVGGLRYRFEPTLQNLDELVGYAIALSPPYKTWMSGWATLSL